VKIDLAVATRFLEDHPDKAAAVLERVSFSDAAALLSELDPTLAAQALARLSASLAVDCLRSMHGEQVAKVLAEVPLDLAARLLRRAEEETRDRWLTTLPPDRAEQLRRRLRYPPGTAGALADPLVLALPADLPVSEAQKQLRRSAERAYYYIYVVDRDHRLVGALDIRELMLAQTRDSLEGVMHRDPVRIPASSDLATITAHPGWRELDALPVVDSGGVFMGIVRHRTLRQMTGLGTGPGQGEPAVRTLVSLGELYWAGLSAFLAGLGRKGEAPPPSREE
jgi:magnesium transporter